jgi:hypothetical protein
MQVKLHGDAVRAYLDGDLDELGVEFMSALENALARGGGTVTLTIEPESGGEEVE